MKIPRDLSGIQLIKKLDRLGYQVTRQTGSHIRLSCNTPTQHHLTIPNHNPLRLGTLSSILGDIATHLKISRDDLAQRLFG